MTEQQRLDNELRHKALLVARSDREKGLIKAISQEYLEALMNTLRARHGQTA